MIILKESSKNIYNQELDDEKKYPPIFYEDFSNPRTRSLDAMQARAYIPAEAIWKVGGYTRYCYALSLNETKYRKKKMYFHISHIPQAIIRAGTANGRRPYPMAFYAMDERMCRDFFKEAQYSLNVEFAYLHQCINVDTLNLFNPDSARDLKTTPVYLQQKWNSILSYLSSKAKIKSRRYWPLLESFEVMDAIYREQCFDGMALDYQVIGKIEKDRTEGLGLFNRAENKIRVVRIAAIPMQDILSNVVFDPRKYEYLTPQEAVDRFNSR